MVRHFDPRALERAAILLKVSGGSSRDEFDAALQAARRAIEYCLQEIHADDGAGDALIEMIDAARSMVRDRP